jgi:oxalate decarboxylase
LAKNLSLPEATFDSFPRTEAYFVHGQVPPEQPAAPHQGGLRSPPNAHKYRLLDQEPHSVHKGGREWRVDADKFPIATTITGVIMDLEPGGLRELHWHPNADEWQYIVGGEVSVTLFGARGRFRVETLNQGDVGYIPQGYGHSIENVGSERARILIALNTGDYQAIDLSAWLAGNPNYLLAAHFNQPESVIEKFPRDDLFIMPK